MTTAIAAALVVAAVPLSADKGLCYLFFLLLLVLLLPLLQLLLQDNVLSAITLSQGVVFSSSILARFWWLCGLRYGWSHQPADACRWGDGDGDGCIIMTVTTIRPPHVIVVVCAGIRCLNQAEVHLEAIRHEEEEEERERIEEEEDEEDEDDVVMMERKPCQIELPHCRWNPLLNKVSDDNDNDGDDKGGGGGGRSGRTPRQFDDANKGRPFPPPRVSSRSVARR